jgi:DNA polymerase gamma 1
LEISLISAKADDDTRVNAVGIQYLPLEMRNKVFGTGRNEQPSPELVEIAKESLAFNNLLGKKTTIDEPIIFDVPRLLGKDLDEHFYKIGRRMSEPYLTIAKSLAAGNLVDKPLKWVQRSGWTKYEPGRNPVAVEWPDEDALVFDIEVLYKISNFPVMATAMSPTAWYSWTSPWLLAETEDPRQLVPLGPPQREMVVIGHNVGYDRRGIKEEYNMKASQRFFIDTMSLHVAVNGMCSRQRPTWMKMKKQKVQGDADDQLGAALRQVEIENPWIEHSAMNSLAEVLEFHCDLKMDKSLRDYFGELDREGVVDMFDELMSYCARDVEATFLVFQKVLPDFVEVCPHPVSFGALRHLASVFVPINGRWQQYLDRSTQAYEKLDQEVQQELKFLVNQAVKLKDDKEEPWKNDPWLSQLDWTITPIKYSKPKKKGDEPLPYKRQKLPGYPQWYRDLFQTANSPMEVTLRQRIAPLLLKLHWDGKPLKWTDKYGWVFKATSQEEIEKYRHRSFVECELDQELLDKFPNDDGRGFFKVPHKDGAEARCVNPLSKNYVVYFDQGVLGSEIEYARNAIGFSAISSYWISSRERILGQMAVYAEDVEDMGLEPGYGMILPRMIPMGTITRRAVEDTWLTASNAKKNRIGSELKAMVNAPPGYKFVGADVDSEELWIASLMGDSLFKLHGGTALGWMTLEGSKSEGTDLHSKTASILGIDRNQAKIFNYGRLYGAGITFAARLLKQFNPNWTEAECKKAADRLYAATKGESSKSSAFAKRKFWHGGSESVVFNRLEEMAEQDVPRTPVLGAAITEALMKSNLRKNNYLTSRINWTIQSSGVDYLHLLIASMHYLTEKYAINARLSLTVHDEIRYLVKEEDVHRACLALQISNLWTRAMFCQQLGLNELPQSVGYFSMVDVDHVLRKEVDLACVTPSNPDPIPPGEALSIKKVLEVCPSLGPGRDIGELYAFEYSPRKPVAATIDADPRPLAWLRAQLATDDAALKEIEGAREPSRRRGGVSSFSNKPPHLKPPDSAFSNVVGVSARSLDDTQVSQFSQSSRYAGQARH